MKTYIITFSPTNQTLACATSLAKHFSNSITVIDLTKPIQEITVEETSLCVIAMPVYAGRIPDLARTRFAQIHGNHAKSVVMAVYGNRAYEDALLELKQEASNNGFTVVAGIAAIAQHSIISSIASNRPDEEDHFTLKVMAEKIKEKLKQPITKDFFVSGNFPYKEGKALPIPIQVNSSCIDCKKCADLCPANAIDLHHVKSTPNNHCISCMRCIAICPVQARQADPLKLKFLEEKLIAVASERKDYELFL